MLLWTLTVPAARSTITFASPSAAWMALVILLTQLPHPIPETSKTNIAGLSCWYGFSRRIYSFNLDTMTRSRPGQGIYLRPEILSNSSGGGPCCITIVPYDLGRRWRTSQLPDVLHQDQIGAELADIPAKAKALDSQSYGSGVETLMAELPLIGCGVPISVCDYALQPQCVEHHGSRTYAHGQCCNHR